MPVFKANPTPQTGVLQVQSTTVSAHTFSTASATYVDITGLSVAITPRSTANKVLVRAVVCCGLSVATEIVNLQLARGGSAIGGGGTGSVVGETRSTDRAYQFVMEYLDSPASVSALTYTAQTLCNAAGYTFYLNRRGSSDLYNGISTITVMEIAG